MFPEFRDLITELKQTDARFQRLFDEHNELDEEISNMEKDPIAGHRHDDIELKKKKKLHLKDEIYQILLKANKSRS